MFIVKRGIIGLLLLAGCTPASGGATARPAGPVHEADRQTTCVVTDKLIPTCGAWWGIAPDVFHRVRPVKAIGRAERRMGRTADILHVYHRAGELFPTDQERALTAGKRLLLVNWKPSRRHTWAEIARGALDARIDKLAAHINRTYSQRFFLTIHHEPENDVSPKPGMSALDYAEMFRHVVLRLRDRGVRNAVTVMTYMGAPNWAAKPWFDQLYPGDDVVDWIGLDPYADHRVEDFAGLVDKTRPEHPSWPGFYRWTQSRFPGKPIMVAEWGAFERKGSPGFKPDFFNSVRLQIQKYPQIKAMVYFDSAQAPRGDTRFDTTPEAAAAFTKLAADRHFNATKVPAA